MKIFTICLALCTSVCIDAFSQTNNASEYSGQVKYESSAATTAGTVTVTSSGFGKKRVNAAADASASAIYVLLFRGIAGSQYELPMITDETKINNSVVQEILKGGYGSFITESTLTDEVKQTRKTDGVKGVSDIYRITINCDALRRYLEKNKVIRKFGI